MYAEYKIKRRFTVPMDGELSYARRYNEELIVDYMMITWEKIHAS
jgi:hypothetical protein